MTPPCVCKGNGSLYRSEHAFACPMAATLRAAPNGTPEPPVPATHRPGPTFDWGGNQYRVCAVCAYTWPCPTAVAGSELSEPPVPATEAPAVLRYDDDDRAYADYLRGREHLNLSERAWLRGFDIGRGIGEREAQDAQRDRVAALEGALARFVEAAEHTHKMGRVTAALDASMFEARALLAPPAPARNTDPGDTEP